MKYVILNQEKNFKELDMMEIILLFNRLIFKVLHKNLENKEATHMYYEGNILLPEDSIVCLN